MAQWQAMHPSERGDRPVDPAVRQKQMQQRKEAAAQQAAQQAQQAQATSTRGKGGFCTNCGERHEAGSKFCQECGERLGGNEPPRQVQQQQPRKQVRGPTVEEENYAAMSEFLTKCRHCGRGFNPERVQRHEAACATASRRRKVFNSHKHRIEGTDMVGAQSSYRTRKSAPSAKNTKWRNQHNELVQAVRAARQMKQIQDRGGSLRDLPPPPPSSNPDFVPCPYCQRTFNQSAAERHIPRCKTTLNKPKPPPNARRSMNSGFGGSASQSRTRPLMASGGRSGGPDPRSNVQTTSIIGSGIPAPRASQPRHDSYGGPTYATGPPPDPKSNVQTVNIFGGPLPKVRNQATYRSDLQPARSNGSGRISSSNTTSSGMYGVFGA